MPNITDVHLHLLKNTCETKKKINLKILKSIVNFYYDAYPNTTEYDNIMKFDNEYQRKNFTKILCQNYDKLYFLVHPEKKDEKTFTLYQMTTSGKYIVPRYYGVKHFNIPEHISLKINKLDSI